VRALSRAGGRERPARAALALVLHGSHGTLLHPIDFVRDADQIDLLHSLRATQATTIFRSATKKKSFDKNKKAIDHLYLKLLNVLVFHTVVDLGKLFSAQITYKSSAMFNQRR
jgi:hypothetical protein